VHEEVRFLLTARTQANDLCRKDSMPKVNLPSADWDSVIYVLEEARKQGYLVGPVLRDIQDQVYKQEN
jgi:hypothetical protein